jgi:acetyl esterase/lipase
VKPWILGLVLLMPQNGPQVPPGVELIKDVEFGTGGGRPLKMHLLRPKDPPKEPLPVVVYVYGGGWKAGTPNAGIGPLSRFVAKGYVCASLEYRLSQEAKFPAQIEDCKCGIRFLRAKAKEYGIDSERIGVWGPSAGGHLVALLGTSGGIQELEGTGGWSEQSSRVQAVVDWFGPTDFLQMGKNKIDHDAGGSPESQLIGGPIQENKEKTAKANPIAYITKDDPPFLIMHGDKDDLVPLNQSELLHAALGKAGVESTLHVVKGGGHGFRGPELDRMIDEFFAKHLGKK